MHLCPFGRIVQAVPPDQPFHASIDRAFHQNEPREKPDILFARDFGDDFFHSNMTVAGEYERRIL